MTNVGWRVGIVGATGAVGARVRELLEERGFPCAELRLLASAASEGIRLPFQGRELEVAQATPAALNGLDLLFFAAGTDVSRRLVPIAVSQGAVVIDKSNAFRMDPEVPLVVPEVNREALRGHRGICASPNCSTIPLVAVLKPLADAAGLSRVTVTTYQAVSGAGRDAMVELRRESQALLTGEAYSRRVYRHQIAFNLIPHIDVFDSEGHTLEERKMVQETRRIMGLPDLRLAATCVRVPVMVGHSEAVLVETSGELTAEEARRALAKAPGVVLVDDPAEEKYPMPVDAAGRDEVFVGRVRPAPSHDRGLWLWCVADNLRKGAATNAIQIAECLLADGLLGDGPSDRTR